MGFKSFSSADFDHGGLQGLGDDDHPQYLKEEASGGVASEVPDHDHTGAAQAGLISTIRLISEQVLGAAAASVAFTNIPQTYRHLLLWVHATSSRVDVADNCLMQINGDNAANYAWQVLLAGGATVTGLESLSDTSILALHISASVAANKRSGGFFVLQDYTGANEKCGQSLGASIEGAISSTANILFLLTGGHWSGTAAITDLLLFPQVGPNFNIGSVFALYGVPRA